MTETVKNFNNIIFDCDSTLVTIEGVDELARKKGVYDEISIITRAAMDGEVNFGEAFKQRWNLLKPCLEDLVWLGELYTKNLTHGAIEVIQKCNFCGISVHIVSGGLKVPCDFLADYLGIPRTNVLAVELRLDKKGMFCGIPKNQLLLSEQGKAKIIKEKFPQKNTLFVGDGCTDLEAKEFVKMFVGFGGCYVRKEVKEKADFFIQGKSLTPLLKFL